MKKLLIFFALVVSFTLGWVCSPHPTVTWDKLDVKVIDYPNNEGTFLLNRNKIRVSKVISTKKLTFLMEPDGTVHLFSQKGSKSLVQHIVKRQSDRFYDYRVTLYHWHKIAVQWRNKLIESITDLAD